MESFIRLAEAIIEFESDFSSTPPAEQNKHGLAIQQDELLENECGSLIKKLQRDINNCLSSLNSHQINVSNWDAIIVYLCSTKLPESTLALWEQTIDHKNDIPKWEDMDKFLSNRFQTLETLSGLKNSKAVRATKPQHTTKIAEASPKRLGVFQASVTKFICIMCQSNEHKLRSCSLFLKLTPSERIELMKNNNSCLNCLKSGHTVSRCTASPKRLGVFQASVTKFTCIMCQSNEHKLRSCSRFLKMTPSERIEFMKNNNSCLNCLKSGHTVSRCTYSFNCSKCHSRHHTLLLLETDQKKPTAHQVPESSTGNPASSSKQAQTKRKTGKPNSNGNKNVKSCFANSNTGVLLGTARVNIHYNGTDFSARALIDSGSECSFITERLKRRINLPSKRLHAQVSGITNAISAQVKEACNIEIRSPIDPLFRSTTTVLVLAQLTGSLPTTHISAVTKQAFPDLVLSDKSAVTKQAFPDLVLSDKRFFVNEQVDLVLGGDIYPEIIFSGLKKNVLNTLLAQETVFGWILTGRTDATSATNHIASYFSEAALDKQLTAFWGVEDLPKSKSLSEEDKYCKELYKSTTQRTKDGKYVVSLPFRQDFPENVGDYINTSSTATSRRCTGKLWCMTIKLSSSA
ncbi:PREDICTED: uncharacterized protein LOC108368673 [Rhagoletis zephyria]|uniref:uncharacterized protein LOC108368673 n=1 Tax=Rhagoletis zephyria TaxID=28612 RepID=UPI00081199B8|nr:PREDICTED: uncharacterized protein LOC108368673 [Rhagoletis zephyria]